MQSSAVTQHRPGACSKRLRKKRPQMSETPGTGHCETWRTHDEYQLHGKVAISCATFFSVGSRHSLSLHTPVIMSDCDGLLVARPTHTAGPSPDEQALAWTLIIESCHIPLRTRLGTCNRKLRRPLRRRQLERVQTIIFQDLHSVWALLHANTG